AAERKSTMNSPWEEVPPAAQSRRDIRVCIVGCGYIAQAEHIPGWLAAPEASICSVVDPNPEVAAVVGARLGVPAFATMAEALAATTPTAVHICASPGAHESLISEAAAG